MKSQKYKFRLSEKERTELFDIRDNSDNAYTEKQKRRADILIQMDNLYYFRCRSRPQDIVASRCGVSTTTVYKVSKQYVEEGLKVAISRKKREKPPVASNVTIEKEAEIIALAHSAPPEGNSRWTLRLLEQKVVELGIIEHISDTTIGRVLKKHQISLT